MLSGFELHPRWVPLMIGFAHDLNKHLSLSTIYFHTENHSLKLDETLEKFRLERIVS